MKTTKSQVTEIITAWANKQATKVQAKTAKFEFFTWDYILREDELEARLEQLEDEMITEDGDHPKLNKMYREHAYILDNTYGQFGSLQVWIDEMVEESYDPDMEPMTFSQEDIEEGCDQEAADREIEDYLKYIRREFR